MPDTLDNIEVFLAKRDGIDKVLKVIRYSSKLVLASALANSDSELAVRLKDFEASIGTSRKAYRLGKWLQNVNKVRKQPVKTRMGVLEVVSNGGEAVYYFVEQFTWLVKAGLISKEYAERFSQISAWAEVVGYCGSSTLNCLRIRASIEREAALTSDLLLRKKHNGETSEESMRAIRVELALLQARRLMRTLAVVQDIADALLTLPDLGSGSYAPVKSKAVLAFAGLVSAAISIHKYWPGPKTFQG